MMIESNNGMESKKQMKMEDKIQVQRGRVIGACKESNKYFHDYLHCTNCAVKNAVNCYLKGCICNGEAFLFPVDTDKHLYAHQMIDHRVSAKIYMNRPTRARICVRNSFDKQRKWINKIQKKKNNASIVETNTLILPQQEQHPYAFTDSDFDFIDEILKSNENGVISEDQSAQEDILLDETDFLNEVAFDSEILEDFSLGLNFDENNEVDIDSISTKKRARED